MKSTLTTLVLALISLATTDGLAEEKTNHWVPSGSLSLSIQERYIGLRGSRLLNDSPSLWSDFNINLPHGVYFDVWEHHALTDRDTSKQPDELDLTLGWRGTLPWYKLELGLATTYFNNAPLDLWWQRDLWAQSATLSRSYSVGAHTFKPQVRVEWISLANDVGGGVTVLMPNITHTWREPLGLKPLSFTHQAWMIRDDGFDPPGNDSHGIFFRYNAGLKWQLSKRLSLTLPAYTIQTPVTRIHDGRREMRSWSSCLSFSF